MPRARAGQLQPDILQPVTGSHQEAGNTQGRPGSRPTRRRNVRKVFSVRRQLHRRLRKARAQVAETGGPDLGSGSLQGRMGLRSQRVQRYPRHGSKTQKILIC